MVDEGWGPCEAWHRPGEATKVWRVGSAHGEGAVFLDPGQLGQAVEVGVPSQQQEIVLGDQGRDPEVVGRGTRNWR